MVIGQYGQDVFMYCRLCERMRHYGSGEEEQDEKDEQLQGNEAEPRLHRAVIGGAPWHGVAGSRCAGTRPGRRSRCGASVVGAWPTRFNAGELGALNDGLRM